MSLLGWLKEGAVGWLVGYFSFAFSVKEEAPPSSSSIPKKILSHVQPAGRKEGGRDEDSFAATAAWIPLVEENSWYSSGISPALFLACFSKYALPIRSQKPRKSTFTPKICPSCLVRGSESLRRRRLSTLPVLCPLARLCLSPSFSHCHIH